MARFVTTESFWELFPTTKIGVVTAKGISNDIDDETAAKIKADLEEYAEATNRTMGDVMPM